MITKFLIIDDDQDDKELFCEALEEIDEHIVCYAEASGRKALEKLDSKKIELPDVVFLDVNMPLMDGWQCLSIMKSIEEYKNIPVIMYSTTSNMEDREKAQQLGATYFFTKPPSFKRLKEDLEVVVNHVKADTLGFIFAGLMFVSFVQADFPK